MTKSIADIVIALIIVGGILSLAVIIACSVAVIDAKRPLIPWGPRSRVEKAKATAEVAEKRLREDAAEIKRLALETKRTEYLEAVRNGKSIDMKELLASDGAEIRTKYYE